MIKDQRALLRAVIEALLVLENSSPEEVDSHVAVRAMENIASWFLALDEDDQCEVRANLTAIAGESSDESYRRFVDAVPEMLGLKGEAISG